MADFIRADFDDLRSLAFGSIIATYTNVGAALQRVSRLICFTNLTNQNVIFSLDGGTRDQILVGAGGFKLFDVTSNKVRSDGLFLPIGSQIAVKAEGTLPTSGSVYVEVLSAVGG